MKKSLAIASGLAVAGSLFAVPQASAVEVEGTLKCDRYVFATGGVDTNGQTPVPVTINIDVPETATVGEEYAVSADIVVPAVTKSGLQATRALGLEAGADYEYQLADFNAEVDESNTIFTTVEVPADSGFKATTGGRFDLGGSYSLKLTNTPEEGETEHTIKELGFEFVEQARVDAEGEVKNVSRYECSFTATEDVKIPVQDAPAEEPENPAEPADPADPATPGDHNGSSNGSSNGGGFLSVLFGLLAGIGAFHFFVAPLLGGANGGIVGGSSALFAWLPKEVRDFFGLN